MGRRALTVRIAVSTSRPGAKCANIANTCPHLTSMRCDRLAERMGLTEMPTKITTRVSCVSLRRVSSSSSPSASNSSDSSSSTKNPAL